MFLGNSMPHPCEVFAFAARVKTDKTLASEERASDPPQVAAPPQVAKIKTVAQTLPNPRACDAVAGLTLSRHRVFDGSAALGFWHLTSLDAPTVAVVWALGFAWAEGVRLPGWIPVLLALAAWAVYVFDRLLDVRGALRTGELGGLRERHRFHHRHRRLLMPLAVAAAAAAAAIVFTLMAAAARDRNSVLAVAALAYFTRVHSNARTADSGGARLFRKELLVGVLFTAACALPAFSRAAVMHGAQIGPFAAAAVFFALLAWLNCHAIERWESGLSEGEPGISSIGARSGVFALAFLLACAGVLAAALIFVVQPRAAVLLLAGAASALLLGLLDRARGRMKPLTLRACADLVLLTPLLLMPLVLFAPFGLLLR
jgi:hypothetical protein